MYDLEKPISEMINKWTFEKQSIENEKIIGGKDSFEDTRGLITTITLTT